MASHKHTSNSKKQAYSRDIHKMRNGDDEERNNRLHMLLSTTYGLNISHTKRIHVGLQTTNEGVFNPLVKLSGNNADGVHFDVDSWQQLKNNIALMNEYFNYDNGTKPNPIVIKNISINFTSSYGAKSILLAYKENEEKQSADNTGEETAADAEPSSKKRRTYSVAIVMQKTTFQGLKNIIKCVDAHLSHLQTLTNSVNECARYLIKEIELKLPRNYIDTDIVKLILKGNYDDIERDVRTQITDLTFLDQYFNIVFLELISLRLNEIFRIVLSNRGT